MVTSRLLVVVLGCRGDLEDDRSATVPDDRSLDVRADNNGVRTMAPPFLGVEDLAPLLLLLLTVTRTVGDFTEGDVSLSLGDNDDVTATASCRKMRSLRRRYRSSV